MTIIDPPSGWKYGFPKPIPEDRIKDATVWLVEQGYPQSLIDDLGEHFGCKYWQEPDEPIVVSNKYITCTNKKQGMTEEQLVSLGFNKEPAGDGNHYYCMDIAGITFITNECSDEVKDGEWTVEMFDNGVLSIYNFDDMSNLIGVLKKYGNNESNT